MNTLANHLMQKYNKKDRTPVSCAVHCRVLPIQKEKWKDKAKDAGKTLNQWMIDKCETE